ncbi:GDP-mannose 4,6-dehydratase [Patescibacteria group bacterium]|nr:GDP-mannose 4,6-dehydratase [Patescibacteria group bacterium]
MRILITGGAGFQGSHIVNYLVQNGHEITILNTFSESSQERLLTLKDKVTTVWGSVTDKELVDKTVREHDLITHLAARINVDESVTDPRSYLDVNIYGTYNILEAIRKLTNRPRLIYWSTCEVYGEPKRGITLNEESELRPQSPYAASKAGADRLCYSYYQTYGLNIVISRFFNIFGEGQKSGQHGALIPIMVERAIHGEPLTVSGTGKQTRDYTYISDVIKAFGLLMNHKELSGQAVNFASGVNTSVIDIAQYIANKLKAKVVHTPARPGEVMKFPADISKAKTLGFKPTVTIWEGIDRYIDWRLSKKEPSSPGASKYISARLFEKPE